MLKKLRFVNIFLIIIVAILFIGHKHYKQQKVIPNHKTQPISGTAKNGVTP